MRVCTPRGFATKPLGGVCVAGVSWQAGTGAALPDLAVALSWWEAEWHYGDAVLEHRRLHDVASTFGGWTAP